MNEFNDIAVFLGWAFALFVTLTIIERVSSKRLETLLKETTEKVADKSDNTENGYRIEPCTDKAVFDIISAWRDQGKLFYSEFAWNALTLGLSQFGHASLVYSGNVLPIVNPVYLVISIKSRVNLDIVLIVSSNYMGRAIKIVHEAVEKAASEKPCGLTYHLTINSVDCMEYQRHRSRKSYGLLSNLRGYTKPPMDAAQNTDTKLILKHLSETFSTFLTKNPYWV